MKRDAGTGQTPVGGTAKVPIAWMHNGEGRCDVIHDTVKKLWERVAEAKQSHSPTFRSHVEHYTIPLFREENAK